jgi:predicted TIM-barrel fold metal-dependent hydrolase
MVYIDAHTHFGKGMPQGIPPDGVEQCIQMMDKIGMDAIIITPCYASISPNRTYDEVNELLAIAMRKYPDRLIGLARVNPHFMERSIELAEKYLIEGFKGIKFHPRNEAFPINHKDLVFPIMKKVEELGGLVLFHTGCPVYSHPTLVGDVADNFPEVPIIIGHMGGRFVDDAILVAKWFDNVFIDTSFCRGVSFIEKAVEVAGAEKVLYASDYPQGSIEVETLKVKLADISNRDKELILGKNVERIILSISKDR